MATPKKKSKSFESPFRQDPVEVPETFSSPPPKVVAKTTSDSTSVVQPPQAEEATPELAALSTIDLSAVVGPPCTICDGSGKELVETIHKLSGIRVMGVVYCVCLKSRMISYSPSLPLLKPLGENYLDLKYHDPRFVINWPVRDRVKNKPKSLWVHGCDLQSFRLQVKAFAMKFKYLDPEPSIYACEAFDVLKKFFVEQEDGSHPSLTELNKYDLLIISIGTRTKNTQLNNCLAQVVYARLTQNLPTWIHTPQKNLKLYQYEYSEELEGFLKNDFVEISYEATTVAPPSEANINSGNFGM